MYGLTQSIGGEKSGTAAFDWFKVIGIDQKSAIKCRKSEIRVCKAFTAIRQASSHQLHLHCFALFPQ